MTNQRPYAPRNRNILISGAGFAGPTLAYWLLHHGFTPTIVERAPALRTGGYMIDFWGVGYDVAEQMGLLPALRRDGYRLDEVRLVDASGRRVAGFDARVFESASKNRYLSLLRSDLARHETYLGYYAAAVSADGYPHRDEGAYVSYAPPGRTVGRYALRDGRSAFLLVFARDEQLPIGHHDVAEQRGILRELFAGAGWECEEILATMDRADDLYFDAVAQTRMDAWSHGRVVLLGDAAYCPSLLAGQGSALAMAGAYVLAHEIGAAAGGHAVAFAAYQCRFKPFVDEKQRTATRLGGWFAPRTRFGIWLRELTTNLMQVPVVADRIAARSFGDRFELPASSDVGTAPRPAGRS